MGRPREQISGINLNWLRWCMTSSAICKSHDWSPRSTSTHRSDIKRLCLNLDSRLSGESKEELSGDEYNRENYIVSLKWMYSFFKVTCCGNHQGATEQWIIFYKSLMSGAFHNRLSHSSRADIHAVRKGPNVWAIMRTLHAVTDWITQIL